MPKAPTPALPPDAKTTIAMLRALVISQKHPYRINDLQREYKQLEGAGMNSSKYGFQTLEEFLTASGEFDLKEYQGETIITARPNKDTAHMVKMVQRQKSQKFKKQQLRNPTASDQSWNKSSFSTNVYPNLVKDSPKKNRPKHTMKSNGDNNNNHVRPNGQLFGGVVNSKTEKQNNKSQIDLRERLQAKREAVNNTNQGNQQNVDLRDRLNAKRGTNGETTQSHVASRAILAQNNKNRPEKLNLQARIKKSQSGSGNNSPNSPVFTLPTFSPQQQTTNVTKPTSPTVNNIKMNGSNPNNSKVNNRLQRGISAEFAKAASIQDRLKIGQTGTVEMATGNVPSTNNSSSTSDISNNTVISATKQKNDKQQKQIGKGNTVRTEKKPREKEVSKSQVFQFNPNMDPVTSLAQYCQFRHYAPPDYKFLRTKFSPRIHARVIVNDVLYSTYPDEFDTEFEARVECAKVAVHQIKAEEARCRFPVSTDSDVELAMKIYQELRNHPHGIFCKNIPEFFQKTFQQTLPDHWFTILQSSKQFIMETIVGNNLIVLANMDSSDASSTTSSLADSEFIVLDRINLPWTEKYWNLYITHCTSTTEIWARIVGKDYSDQLDSIMTDVDLSMLTTKTRPTSILCGQIYLVSMSECWHRVRVENMNKSDGKCLCFFIDFGDEEWLPMDQLFVCEPRFLKLPPQAVPLSLYGLEDFAENPNAKIHLDSMLIGKTLIAEILTKKETFEALNDADVEFSSRIQVVLYDTSSNEDVNLNPLLLTKICDDTPPPELRRTGATNVTVTHVNNNGEIFVQVKSIGLSYIQKLISQLVESKFKEEEHQVVLADLKKPDSLFFIQDQDDMKWYRGALVTDDNGKIEGNRYNMFYVDYGRTKMTNISRIFRLESLSVALSKFPRQAIKVKLHNLPPISETTVARIRGLLPPESPAIAKVAAHGLVPQVVIYTRFDTKELLVNVNEVIRIEYELEGAADQQPDTQSGAGSDESRCNSAASNHSSNVKSSITVPASPLKSELQKLSDPTCIPPIGEDFNVFVSMASNPGNFVVQPYSEGPKLSELMKSLQEYCLNNEEFIPNDMVEIGQAYAALNEDGIYHRVTVENIFNNSSMVQFLVSFCDFGDFAVLSNDKLKTLPAKFRTLPKQAIMAKLYGVKPKHCDWTVNDCMRFRELTVGQRFASIIRRISNDVVVPNSKVLELELIDVQTDEDIYVHEILINEDRAIADIETE